ncbi:MAG: hypothetical protein ABJ004_18090 [Cyclobacteriaceae bacterium]
MQDEKIESINRVISAYLEDNKQANIIAVKELMPDFIKAGIFPKDEKKGLPIRKLLRSLDAEGALDKIPAIHAERKDKNTFWYVVREGHSYVSDAPNDTGLTKKQKAKKVESESDEHYLITLCDELLKESASRKQTFGFILGDYHKDGRTRSLLPVDAFYPGHNLVIELEREGDLDRVDNPNRKIENGLTRARQKAIYADRKRNALTERGVKFIEIQYESFDQNDENELVRDKEKDLKVLSDYLKAFLA